MVLAPDCRLTWSCTVGTPLSRASDRCSLVPSSAEPMSRMRIGTPFTVETTRSLKASGTTNPPHGAKHLFARAGGHIAARYVGVLPLDRVSNRGDGYLIGG